MPVSKDSPSFNNEAIASRMLHCSRRLISSSARSPKWKDISLSTPYHFSLYFSYLSTVHLRGLGNSECRPASTAKTRGGAERWDYLNTVVSGVSCDPPGCSRWPPLGSVTSASHPTGAPLTYGGHLLTELPPSSFSSVDVLSQEGSIK